MVIKRALKMFECPPSLTEETEDVTEIVKRVEKCLDSIVAKRVSDSRLELTHGRLWEETKRLLKKLKMVDIQDDKNRIVWEDTRSCLIDCLEKLTTHCPFNKQEMFGRDDEISGIKEDLLKKQRGTSMARIEDEISAIKEEFLKNNKISGIKEELLKKQRGTSISIIIIGGVTGIGKTMLAQYLFDDPQVSEAFQVRDWINCDNLRFDRIYKTDDRFTLVDVIETSCGCQENQIIPSVLIIFDGWKHPTFYVQSAISHIAKERLPMCLKIIVTTSNLSFLDDTPRHTYMGGPTQTLHLLGGLQEESSWALFESLALSADGSNEEKTRILESKIGLKILSMCGTNPCVIKTVASILSTKITLEEWKHFIEVVWPSLHSPAETITSNLNLASFKRLPFLMKRCLLYSSLFPKDYQFNKADLNLWWMIEINSYVGDEYFQNLQNMGYFIQHTKTDDNDTLSYKMPILSCEFLKTVADQYNEYQSFDGSGENEHVDPDTIQHVSFIVNGSSWRAPPWLGAAKNLRSFLFLGQSCETITGIESIITSLRFLQILNITMVNNCEKLARYFGNLELLTSLRLGITAPDFITELLTRTQNLRVLDLQRSNAHIILTQGFQKLLRLEYLYIGGNMFDELLPSRGELLSLSKSNVLMMGRNNAINRLADYNYIAQNETMTDYSKSEELSKDIYDFCERALIWVSPCHENEDVVLKTLQAPPTLKSLTIRHWNRLITVPQFLALSSIKIMDCHKCQSLPSFGMLPKLKSFTLWNLSALEYIESTNLREDIPYFPCLESLILANLPKLETWEDYDRIKTKNEEEKQIRSLTKLQISNSTKLHFIPIMGNIVSLDANDMSNKFLKYLISSTSSIAAALKTLNISAIRGLGSISIKLPKLESMIIRQCQELATLNVESPSIKSLGFHDCGKLKKLSMAGQDMTNLMKLEIDCCPELDIANMIPWKSLNNLGHLKLMNVAKLESLPDGLSWLAELKTLSICWVYNLKALPEWICSLEHLRRLIVRNCPSLTTIPESLGELLNDSKELGVEFSNCYALKRFPKSFPQNQSSQLVIKGCPKLETSMHEQDVSI